MKIAGVILVALGIVSLINGNPTPPGADSAEAAGAAMAPFILMGIGGLLSWAGSKKSQT